MTITNDKSRLSKDEIERMVHEAELYKTEDDENVQRVTSKNTLENYMYTTKSSISSMENKTEIETVLTGTQDWLELNHNATKIELDNKLQEIQQRISPLLQTNPTQHSEPTPQTNPTQHSEPDQPCTQPHIEEVD